MQVLCSWKVCDHDVQTSFEKNTGDKNFVNMHMGGKWYLLIVTIDIYMFVSLWHHAEEIRGKCTGRSRHNQMFVFISR